MQVVAVVVYIGIGLLQLAATMAGLENWIGLHWLVAAPIAMVLAYIPLVGSIVGMLGSVHAWGWEWWQAAALFFGAFLLSVVLASIGGVAQAILHRKPA